MNKENYNIVLEKLAFAPIAYTTDTAANVGIAMDCQGYESLTVTAFLGVRSAGTVTLSITECDTESGTYTAVPTANIVGTAVAMDATNEVNSLGAVLTKRWAKCVLTTVGATAVVGAVGVLGHPAKATVR